MRYTARLAIALGSLGAVAFAGTAVAQSDRPTEDKAADPTRPAHKRAQGGGFGKRVVTGEFKVKTRDGFATVRVDHGTVKSVEGNTLALERADGQTVTVTATDDTRIRKNGEQARLADIEAGDLVRVMRRDDGDGLVLRGIHARTPGSEVERASRPRGRARGIRPALQPGSDDSAFAA